MPDKIRLGILSTAGIGRKRVIPALKQAHNLEVAAVASRDLARAQAFAADLGIPRAYGSYEELLADPAIDAIYNPLPNSMHLEWSVKAAEAGKPMLCEKPLAKDAADAQAMVDAFATRGLLFAEAFMYRFHPQIERVKALIDQGELGTLQTMSAAFTFVVRQEDDIRLSQTLAGGALRDVGCYCINIQRLMTGEEPEQVQGAGRVGAASGVDEALAGVLRFPSGVVGHFDCSLRAQQTHLFDVRGTRGRILIEKAFVPAPDEPTFIRFWHGERYEEIRIPPANHYTLMGVDFAAALLENRPPRFAPGDGVANMRVIDTLLAQVNPQ